MVFSSAVFLTAFLPLTLALHAVTRARTRNAVLLAASLVFYAIGSDRFVLVLVLTSLVDYGISQRVSPGASPHARAWLALSLAFNLGLLGWFKYANFAVTQLDALRGAFGTTPIAWSEVLLPVGISFFVFQRMSYLIDVHRDVHPPARSFFDFLLYVALFPQLIAGPIVRWDEIREEVRDRMPATSDVAVGATRFVVGLLKKVVIADTVAPVADAVFDGGGALTMASAGIGTLAYSIQIYFDFSGYSDMAIGLGRMLGFTFPENFVRPYSAQSVTDFWRRWHVTLSRWFRDYLYVPLGGSRRRPARVLLNLAIVFLLTGLWHGAAWTFVVWGGYHGLWLILERVLDQRRFTVTGPERALRRAVTAVIVTVGWIPFRAETLTDATRVITGLATPSLAIAPDVALALDNRALVVLVLAATVYLLPATGAIARRLEVPTGPATARTSVRLAAARTAIVALGLPVGLVIASSSTFSPFLYFRF